MSAAWARGAACRERERHDGCYGTHEERAFEAGQT